MHSWSIYAIVLKIRDQPIHRVNNERIGILNERSAVFNDRHQTTDDGNGFTNQLALTHHVFVFHRELPAMRSRLREGHLDQPVRKHLVLTWVPIRAYCFIAKDMVDLLAWSKLASQPAKF